MKSVVGAMVFLAVIAAARPRTSPRRVRAARRSVPSPGWIVTIVGRAVEVRLPIELLVTAPEIGWALVLSAIALVLAPPLALLPPSVVLLLSGRRRRSKARGRVDAVRRGLPEVVDLLVLGVGAGLTVRHALALSVEWMPPPFSTAFAEAIRRSAAGEAFSDSLEATVVVLGASIRPLITVLVAAERDGAALVPALQRASDEARRRRRVEAEEAARRVPVMMLFPLVLCVLPAFALLTVVPVLLGTLADLQLPAAGP